MKQYRKRIAFKSISGIVLMLVLFTVIVGYIGYREFSNELLDEYAEGAFRTADAAAYAVDADRMAAYAESEGKTEEYREALTNLDLLCNASGATFVYVIRPDLSDYAHITFLFSTKNRDSRYSLYDFGFVRETTNDEYREKYRLLYEGASDRELVIRDRGYIETDAHITAMIPLRGASGRTQAILCVQRQMAAMTEARHAYVRKVILALIAIVLIVIAGQGVYLHKVLLVPVRKIAAEAGRFAEENASAGNRLTDSIRNRDEIGLLADSVDRMEERIESYVRDLTKITAERERISAELSLAERIQNAMLPDVFPPFPDRTEFDLYASMDPAREVGGDFYNYFLIDDDHLCVYIADVSGKGVPAALFMMACTIMFANHSIMGKSPAKVLEDVNAAICRNNREEMFVTVWLGILEISSGRLIAANAGHEYPMLRGPEGTFAIVKDRHGFVVGGMDGVKYHDYEIRLEPGSRLFLYTDGLPEATAGDGEMFGTDRVLAALNEDAGAAPREILGSVRKAADSFVNGAEQFDDLTILCLSYEGKLPGGNGTAEA